MVTYNVQHFGCPQFIKICSHPIAREDTWTFYYILRHIPRLYLDRIQVYEELYNVKKSAFCPRQQQQYHSSCREQCSSVCEYHISCWEHSSLWYHHSDCSMGAQKQLMRSPQQLLGAPHQLLGAPQQLFGIPQQHMGSP